MSSTHLDCKAARILVVDDETPNVLLLEDILEEAGYRNVHSTTDSRKTQQMVADLKPNLILLDLMMPHLDGFEVMSLLRSAPKQGPFLPILVLTADVSQQTRERALTSGANDFLTKPFDHTEVLLRIHNLVELNLLHHELYEHNRTLEARVRERTAQLEESHRLLELSQFEIIERLAHAAEFRDDDTGQHTRRVGNGCALLAAMLGFDNQRVELMRRAAPLHDAGKIGIPDHILLKPARLTPEEFAIMKRHALIGGELLSGGLSELVQMAENIASTHHERWDGGGYPHGVGGTEIPLVGRILAVVDVFDALTHSRPYKNAWPADEAVAEIIKQSGKQFDPAVVDVFKDAWQELHDSETEKSPI